MVLVEGAAGAEAMLGLDHWMETARVHRTWAVLVRLTRPGLVNWIGLVRASWIWFGLVHRSGRELVHWPGPAVASRAVPPANRLEFSELDRPRGQSGRFSGNYPDLSATRRSRAAGYGCLQGPDTPRDYPASSPEPVLRSSRPLPAA